MIDRVGQQFGNYRLVRLLGRGGFAEVYLGEHIRLKTSAAIKVLLHTQLTARDEEKFLAEAHTIAHMEHPHIILILDFDVREGIPFLVMSYASEGTLRQRHPKGSIVPATSILQYVQQTADALQYAYKQKLIHRDVKPENMLLGKDNQVLLSDFGLALTINSSRYQSLQEVAGTVSYMAPEQIQGRPRAASDQYALGIVIYEWLCGERPFHGSFSEIATQHILAPPPPLHQKVPAIPATLENVVMKALAKNPHERFTNVKEFAAAIEQACQSSIEPGPITMSDAPPPPMQNIFPPQPVLSSSPTAPLDPSPLSASSKDPSPYHPITHPSSTPGAPQQSKRRSLPRALLLSLIVLVVIIGAGILSVTSGLITPSFQDHSANVSNIALTGTVQSVNTRAGTVTLSVNGQTYTIGGLSSADLTNLQQNPGKTFKIQAAQNGNSYTIVANTSPVETDNAQQGTNSTPASQNQSTGVNQPGSISFIGKVQSSDASSVTVSMPNGDTLSMSISSLTQRSDFPGQIPTGQQINVTALANADGSFTAKVLQAIAAADAQNPTKLSEVDFQAVVTSAVGADNVIHFQVGNKSYSVIANSGTQVKSFTSLQAIPANQTVLLYIQYNGSNGNLIKVDNGNGQ